MPMIDMMTNHKVRIHKYSEEYFNLIFLFDLLNRKKSNEFRYIDIMNVQLDFNLSLR